MIFAIDPGSVQSGWVHYEDGRVLACGVDENEALLLKLLDARMSDELVIEMMKARGMPVSNDEMRTLVWIGRFQQQWHKPSSVRLVYRADVKLHICGSMKAKDANIRQALIDMFPGTGGGATPQVGTKAKPGPLYGMASHAWPALAVAVTAQARAA